MTHMNPPRVILIVLDGVGVGALPDAADYGDAGNDTLGNLSQAVGGLRLPRLESMGLGHLTAVLGVPPCPAAIGGFGTCRELSAGKDSISGHWELMGVVTERPFPVYPDGFPADLLKTFTRLTGHETLFGKPASGTEIINRLGQEHRRTGALIVYTSADSVFQIAAHEDVVPVAELYRVCAVAREFLRGEHGVARVIARPFTGEPGAFTRTPGRHDYALAPPPHVLDALTAAEIPVTGIGKIDDLYAHRGISKVITTVDNQDGMEKTRAELNVTPHGLIMTNLIQFDQDWGHRNDCEGFKQGLESFDRWLGDFFQAMSARDTVIITADHGVDPTTASTDHSREHVPFLIAGPRVPGHETLGERGSFADVGATVAKLFGLPRPRAGSPIPLTSDAKNIH
ncbi:MAG: phosphopentomutase [Lentisphaeria bacterium]|nr:phosphopentomutase [Lentisphaeria bacterium]